MNGIFQFLMSKLCNKVISLRLMPKKPFAIKKKKIP